MDAVKETIKSATGTSESQKGHFEQGKPVDMAEKVAKHVYSGHKVPVSHQSFPGKQYKMPLEAVNDLLPTATGGYQPYQAAGKLRGKKAVITGGDSGIGRAVAILYAMEGTESLIVYLPEEEEDARETQRLVSLKGGTLHLLRADLRTSETCKNVVQAALAAMGTINILVLNHGFQMTQKDISDISEYVIPSTSFPGNLLS